jgi:hypothetical protein
MNKQLQSDIADNPKDDNVDFDVDFGLIGGIMPMMKIQLKNWSFTANGDDGYKAPEQLIPCLQGNVYGHPNPKHHDGKFIVTSKLIGKRNGLAITQSGSEYELGDVDPNYEKAFPNAKDRLFTQLKDV